MPGFEHEFFRADQAKGNFSVVFLTGIIE